MAAVAVVAAVTAVAAVVAVVAAVAAVAAVVAVAAAMAAAVATAMAAAVAAAVATPGRGLRAARQSHHQNETVHLPILPKEQKESQPLRSGTVPKRPEPLLKRCVTSQRVRVSRNEAREAPRKWEPEMSRCQPQRDAPGCDRVPLLCPSGSLLNRAG